MRYRTKNPVFRRVVNSDMIYEGTSATYKGVAGKTIYYVLMLFVGAFGGLFLAQENPDLFSVLLTISISTTFIFGLIALLAPRTTKVIGTLYCLAQGLIVGVVSLAFESLAPGAVTIALLSTIVVLMVVATLFLTNIVKVNGRFMRFLTTFAISVIISMFLIFLLGIITNQPVNFGGSLLISSIMIFLATLYLMFDMEYIRQIVEGGAPKEMEWYVSFGLVFTLVWLYIEILPIVFRFLARDN